MSDSSGTETASNTRQVETAANRATVETAAGTPQAEQPQMVKVRAKAFFPKGEVGKSDMCAPGDEIDVERLRGAELRANGLVEYVDTDKEKQAAEADPAPVIEGAPEGVVMRRRGRVGPV